MQLYLNTHEWRVALYDLINTAQEETTVILENHLMESKSLNGIPWHSGGIAIKSQAHHTLRAFRYDGTRVELLWKIGTLQSSMDP